MFFIGTQCISAGASAVDDGTVH